MRFSSLDAWNFSQNFRRNADPVPVRGKEPDQRFECLSVASVIAHEVRHFHDFLITPYSARVLSHRVRLLFYVLQMLGELVGDGANCLPVPLTRWCTLTEDERREQLMWMSNGVGSLRTPAIPVMSAEMLAAPPLPNSGSFWPDLLKAICQVQSKISNLTHNPQFVSSGGSFQTWQIYELSALLIQVQDIWQTYGQDETEFYINTLLTQNNVYARVFHMVSEMWHRHGLPLDSNVTSGLFSGA